MKRLARRGAALVWWAPLLAVWIAAGGCSSDISVTATCPDGACVDNGGGGGDGGVTDSGGGDDAVTDDAEGDAVTDDATTDSGGGGDAEEDAPSASCLDMFGYCAIDEATCTDACGSVLGVWPPAIEAAWTVRDVNATGVVNVQTYANYLFASVITWPADRSNPLMLVSRLSPDYRATSVEPLVGVTFTADKEALDVFYGAPAMQALKRGSPLTARLVVPFVGLSSDERGTRLRHAEFNITQEAFGFSELEGSVGIEAPVQPKRVVQPALFAFVNSASEGELWSGVQHQGRVEQWITTEDDHEVALDKVDSSESVSGCNNVFAPQTSSVTVLSRQPLQPAYMDCFAQGTTDTASLQVFPDRDGDVDPEAVEGVWAGELLSPPVVYNDGDASFIARVVRDISGAPAIQVVNRLNGSDAPSSFIDAQLGALIERIALAEGVTLNYCPSLTDGIALAQLDGSGPPELVVLVRAASDCAQDAGSAADQRSFLVRYQVMGGGLTPINFTGLGVANSTLQGAMLTGPLVANIDGDEAQEYIVGVVSDRRVGRFGGDAGYSVQYIDDDGALKPLETLSRQPVERSDNPDGLDESPFFEVPVSIGDYRPNRSGLELMVLRMYRRGTDTPLRPARLIMYALPNVTTEPPQWPSRLGGGGLTGAWIP